MSAIEVEPWVDSTRADSTLERLQSLMTELADLVNDTSPATEACRIDRITLLERLRAATAALQFAETVRFARDRVAASMAKDVDPREIGAGLADELGLACRLSPFHGGRRLETARALWFDLPQTYAALTRGDLSERVAESIVEQTRHLDHDQRMAVDAQIHAAGITGMGVRAAQACAKKQAYEIDRQAYVDRGRTARKDRRVTLRPAPDTMSFLTGYLPVEQGVSCWKALLTAADTAKVAGDERTRGQIMADTLVERITGQATAADVNVELQILLPAAVLADPDSSRTATIEGMGPIPGRLARDLVDLSRGQKTWRTVNGEVNPASGPERGTVTAISPRKRRFTGQLADLIKLRDQTCRMPYCDAPIRHLDHIVEFARGGPTTLANGQGLCERHNQLRNVAGWRTDVLQPGRRGRPHETLITTPTGHQYRSRAPAPP